MNPTKATPCLHCEAGATGALPASVSAMCRQVWDSPALQENHPLDTGLDAHLQKLSERARAGLPLFSDEPAKEKCDEKIEKVRSA